MHSAYLHKALRSFSSIGGSLFIFGHSLDDNDDHVLGKIPTSKIHDLFVGLHDDSNSTHNQKIIKKARKFWGGKVSHTTQTTTERVFL